MSADPQPPMSARDPGVWQTGSVADELETLFVQATGRPSGPPDVSGPSPRFQAVTLSARERRGRGPAVGALVAAGLVGLAMGALLVSSPALRPAPRPARVAAVATQAVARQAAATPAAILATSEPVAIAPPTAASVITASAPTRRAPSICGGDHCSHADLLAADRRLRKAYTRAISAGVPRAVLVTYRNRWDSLRHDAVYRPNRVATGYSSMAGDLNRMANRRRAARRAS